MLLEIHLQLWILEHYGLLYIYLLELSLDKRSETYLMRSETSIPTGLAGLLCIDLQGYQVRPNYLLTILTKCY